MEITRSNLLHLRKQSISENDIKTLYSQLNIIEITKPCQRNRGTVMYIDTINDVLYSFHKNGYFRRRSFNQCYLLNPKRISAYGYTYDYTSFENNILKQMIYAISAIVNYRTSTYVHHNCMPWQRKYPLR
jgi:hypothetical protein